MNEYKSCPNWAERNSKILADALPKQFPIGPISESLRNIMTGMEKLERLNSELNPKQVKSGTDKTRPRRRKGMNLEEQLLNLSANYTNADVARQVIMYNAIRFAHSPDKKIKTVVIAENTSDKQDLLIQLSKYNDEAGAWVDIRLLSEAKTLDETELALPTPNVHKALISMLLKKELKSVKREAMKTNNATVAKTVAECTALIRPITTLVDALASKAFSIGFDSKTSKLEANMYLTYIDLLRTTFSQAIAKHTPSDTTMSVISDAIKERLDYLSTENNDNVTGNADRAILAPDDLMTTLMTMRSMLVNVLHIMSSENQSLTTDVKDLRSRNDAMNKYITALLTNVALIIEDQEPDHKAEIGQEHLSQLTESTVIPALQKHYTGLKSIRSEIRNVKAEHRQLQGRLDNASLWTRLKYLFTSKLD